MLNNSFLLEEYSPVEAKGAGEFPFLGWLFLIQQVIAFVVLLGVILDLFEKTFVGPVLDVCSQNTVFGVFVVLLVLHLAVFLVLLLVRKPIVWWTVLVFLFAMALFSIVESTVGKGNYYNTAGIVVSFAWWAYFLFAKRIRVRFFFDRVFQKEVHTIICPHCGEPTVFLAESCCGKTLTEDERFEALSGRLSDVKISLDVRVAQIELFGKHFGKRALPLLKTLYEKQLSSPFRMAKLASVLKKTIDSLS